MTYFLYIKLVDFPIAVERQLNPGLQKRPVVVAEGTSEDIRIIAASQEARKLGITHESRVGGVMRMKKVTVVPADWSRYRNTSDTILRHFESWMPTEAEEVPGTYTLYPQTRDIDHLEDNISQILQPDFNYRAGLATLPVLSQAAADRAQTNRINIIASGQERSFWDTISITWFPWVGPRKKKDMLEMGIRTVGDFLSLDPVLTQTFWGSDIWKLRQWLTSENPNPTTPKTVGRRFERVFPRATYGQDQVLEGLDSACQQAASWLRQSACTPSKLGLAVRYPDGSGRRGHIPLPVAVNDRDFFYRSGILLKQLWTRRLRLERLEIVFTALRGINGQLSLFEHRNNDRTNRLGSAMDHVRSRYGFSSINYGSSIAMYLMLKKQRALRQG
jgi:nucleotidyltransferase/DNA polymerase involved in DNA repair